MSKQEYNKQYYLKHKKEAKERMLQYNITEKESIKENKRTYYLEHKAEKAVYDRKYYIKNKYRVLAKCKLADALDQGKITKLPCWICGDLLVDGHHPNYTSPLDVIWLCKICHAKEHRKYKE